MSRFRLVRHLRATSGGGGGGGGASGVTMGINVADTGWTTPNIVLNNIQFGGPTALMPGAVDVPAANMSTDGFVTSLPSGKTAIRYAFQTPEDTSQLAVTFTGGNAVASISPLNCTINAQDLAAGTATITPTHSQQDGGNAPNLDLTPSGTTMPKVTSVIKSGTSGLLSANFATQMAQAVSSGGTIRTLDLTGVNLNQGFFNACFPTPPLSSTNRNSLSGGDWSINDGLNGGRKNDGMPFEVIVQIANQLGCNVWHTLPWNATDDYYQWIADYAAANLTGTLYCEVGNENWNFSFKVPGQARNEAAMAGLNSMYGDIPTVITGSVSGQVLTVQSVISGPAIGTGVAVVTTDGNVGVIMSNGTGTGGTGTYNLRLQDSFTCPSGTRMAVNGGSNAERAAERCIEVMDLMYARFTAAGKTSKFKRVFAWSNALGSGWAASLLDYAPARSGTFSGSHTALKNHVDIYAAGLYWGNGGGSLLDDTPGMSATHYNAIIAAGHREIDQTIANFKAIQTACASRVNAQGATIQAAVYEGGQSFYLSDLTTLQNVMRGPEMYTLTMTWLQKAYTQLGSILLNYYANAGQLSTSSSGSWGAKEGSYQTDYTNVPRMRALKDYVAGVRITLDTTAPVLSGQSASSVTTAGCTLNTTTTKGTGVLYWVITTSATVPTAKQVRNGQNDAGSAAVASGYVDISSSGAKTATVTGLTTGTTYHAYLMHEDITANDSTVVGVTFTTA